jgi:rhodanese-related sulfurtransferase
MRLPFIIALCVAAFPAVEASAQSPETTRNVPEKKQTNLGLYLTAKEAYEKWKAEPDKVKILDVRTPEEYTFVGHPEMAWNIPFLIVTHQWDVDKSMYVLKSNQEFIAQVKEWAKPDDTLLVMCRSGGRSAKAVDALARAGFTNTFNIIDGMEGDTVKDPENLYDGKRMKNGWKNSGLPWTYKIDREQAWVPKRLSEK